MSANPPYGYTYTSAAPPLFASPFTVAATGADAGQRFPLQKVAFGASRANPNGTVNWTQFEPLVGIPAVDPNDVTPYAQHWMASVERQFSASTLPPSATSAPPSHHLLVLEEANPANPALCLSLGSALAAPSTSRPRAPNSAPHSAASSCSAPSPTPTTTPSKPPLNHRSHGLDLLASYTYSKSIDQSSGLPEPVNPVNPSLSRAPLRL